MVNRNRFLLPVLVFVFAYFFGFIFKSFTTLPPAKILAKPIQTYLEIKYIHRFEAAKNIFGSVFSIFLLNAVTYSANLFLGPFTVWLIHRFKQENPTRSVVFFAEKMNKLLSAKTKFGPNELLFYYLAPLTLVFWMGFDGGLFQRPQVFFYPYAWIEFFVTFFSAAIGLSLVEVPLKTAILHYLFLLPYLFLAAVLESAI